MSPFAYSEPSRVAHFATSPATSSGPSPYSDLLPVAYSAPPPAAHYMPFPSTYYAPPPAIYHTPSAHSSMHAQQPVVYSTHATSQQTRSRHGRHALGPYGYYSSATPWSQDQHHRSHRRRHYRHRSLRDRILRWFGIGHSQKGWSFFGGFGNKHSKYVDVNGREVDRVGRPVYYV